MRQGKKVGLTAKDMSDMSRLAQLAANPQDTTREEIYLAVASLYRVQGNHLSNRERGLMREILQRLTRDVEMAIRIALAERLAEDTAAPNDLILLLADDTIEVARPVILRSPLLTDDDMLRLIAESDHHHQEAVAARPNIGETISAALAKCEHEPVLAALVRNTTARITGETYEILVDKSRRFTGLQDPIARRTDLPPVLATKMCGWVSDALKIYIVQNYSVERNKLDAAVASAERTIASEPLTPRLTPAESAQKLVEKLYAAGQLKAGFLLRVLHQGQIDLFDLAFAKLLNQTLGEWRRTFYELGPRPVALACRAVGIDRCVFATVFKLSRQARLLKPILTPADLQIVDSAFANYTKITARDELQISIKNS